MSRFHLTSVKKDHVTAGNISKKAGLNVFGQKSELGYYIQTYQKRSIDNTNFVEIGDDWICSAGTLIRNGKLGKKPLKELYGFLTKEGIKTVRQKFVGHYAIAAKVGNEIKIFTDPHGSHQLYYTNPDSTFFIISNSLHTIGHCLNSAEVNPLAVIQYALQGAEISSNSLFENAYRLNGSQCISIDITGEKMTVHNFDMGMKTLASNASIQKSVVEYANILMDVLHHLDGINNIALNTTGGLDTRTLLAGILNLGLDTMLIYGVGNSRLTNTKRSDLIIAKELGEQFNLPFYQMDWSGQHPHSHEKNLANFEKFGFNYTIYGSADSLLKELQGNISPYPQLQLSGYGPSLSNSAPWEYPNKEYSIIDLVRLIAPDVIYSKSFVRTTEYEDYLGKSVRTALNHSDIFYPETEATLSSLVQAQTYLRVKAAAGMLNFANEFNYFFAPFMMKRLHDPLVTVPMKFRTKDEFQVRLTHLLNEDTLMVPVFSGLEPQIIDFEKYNMNSPKIYHLKRTALSTAQLLFPHIIYPIARKIYTCLDADPDDTLNINKKIRSNSSKYILENRLVSNYINGTAYFGLRDLNRLHKVLFGVDEIMKGKNKKNR